MKFIADRMLGRLAKWLRAFGLDVYYDRNVDRSSLIRIAREEERVILTRAQNFNQLKHIPSYYLVNSEVLEDQLREITTHFKKLNLKGGSFTRCMECNVLLNKISKKDVLGKVPQMAYDFHDDYMFCPKCNRIYWEGTHVEKMRRVLNGIKA